jgi:DNA-binding CsgD family transcriptional regulator
VLVEQARHGAAESLVVHGEPGVGKSALLEELAESASGACVLRTQGLEAESPLAFAALHRLLRPVMRLRAGLPDPQSRALRVAFGEEEGPSVEPFLVAVATLSILTAAAEESLVLCVIDDAHWLDPSTADALLFAARRMGADRVVMVFSARDGAAQQFRPEGIPAMALRGLDPAAARALLDERVSDVRAEEVTQRLVSETGGNPLALLELPMELSAAQLLGSSPLPAQLLLTARVERAFLDRCHRLPEQVQSLLLLAAADDTGQLATVKRAAESLGIDADAVDAAVGSGLMVADAEAVRVRHPLVRSAIYQAAASGERRRVHRALAGALSEAGDPDRTAWHRAAAAEGPDEEVVAALELAGSRAERRGGYVAALAAYERAAALTAQESLRAGRLFAAARNAWACGRATHSRALLSSARECVADPLLRSDIARLRGRIEVNVGSAADAHRIFVEAAHAVHESDPLRALEMAVAAAVMRTYGAGSGATLDADDVRVELCGEDSVRTLCLKQLLLSMTLAADGHWSGAVAALEVALCRGDAVDDLDVLGNLGNAALQLGDDESHRRFHTLMLSRAREGGAVMAVVYALQRLAFGHLLAGNWAALRSSAEEALALGRSVGQRTLTAAPLAWLTLLAALQNRPDYDSLLGELEEVVTVHPLGILTDPVHDLTRWAKGTRAAAAGDTFGALHHLGRLRLPALTRMAAVERIDAAVRAGEPQLARQWAEELAPFADATGWPWALAAVAYGRAMTAGPAGAGDLFQLALSHQTRAGRPYDEARTHLAYGEWLRRAQRRVDARRHLRHALETFQDVRAEALSGRAMQELRASGETARKRDPSTLVQLTPMELKVAQLVSSGLSNKDVAAQCWVSPRTVAFHLRNVFTKAGVTSRGELAQLELV